MNWAKEAIVGHFHIDVGARSSEGGLGQRGVGLVGVAGISASSAVTAAKRAAHDTNVGTPSAPVPSAGERGSATATRMNQVARSEADPYV